MKIALIGYGKMGKEVEQIALQRMHDIVFKADENNADFKPAELSKAEIAIEFTNPASAVKNIFKCFDANKPENMIGIPVVVGTTGWYGDFEEVKRISFAENQSLFHATNFSIGVNIFFEINKKLASLMNSFPDYEVKMEEIHHIQKLDAPSGTAISLAHDILSNLKRKKGWISRLKVPRQKKIKLLSDEFEILSVRKNNVPGTHIIEYNSLIDSIEIKHTAKSRKGFALGAVLAAEWLLQRKGVFSMSDMLKLK